MSKLTIVLLFAALLSACGAQQSANSNTNTNTKPTPPVASPKPDVELQKQTAEIAKEAKGTVGVFATVIETGQSVALNENAHFALQSVVKVPIAMAVLKKVEEGNLDLEEKIGVTKEDFVPSSMRSPIRNNNPNGVELTIRELIRFAISESDGTASDVLQHRAGDAKGVQAYIDSVGVQGIHVERTHKEFGLDWNKQYDNWATPTAVADLLKKLLSADGISGENREILIRFMTESDNPTNRILAGVPLGTVVAHKTGTGGTLNGIAAATNDVGIITLPNGNHIVIAIFVGDSKANAPTRESVIAKITKAIFDKWSVAKTDEPAKNANANKRHSTE